MSGNTKEKIAVSNNAGKKTPDATAPMASAYANATVLEKIEKLAATFRHRKCNETSLRFLFLNIKGNDQSYQTPSLKGPPLGSLLNPHRNAFRFVSIGVSVEILRRKQVGLFLACFNSLRSNLSDLHSLHSDLSGLRKVLLWVLF
ncbi:hypothetical protein F2Q68_00009635 [Brassica cretica]|uniref:Uncharacterized protein n=1 Tax=Brassica cretica TaxID=69181 RepID=A0A8S9KYR1_BRACR|nr:hypothetical protein F2Q68_00009635 [Brassica cretica]